jgi:hypothetical protein
MNTLNIFKNFNILFLLLSLLNILHCSVFYVNTFYKRDMSLSDINFIPYRLIVLIILVFISLILAEEQVGNLKDKNGDKLINACPLWIKSLFRVSFIFGLIHIFLCIAIGVLSIDDPLVWNLFYLRIALGTSIVLYIYISIFFYAVSRIKKAV